MSTPNFKRTKYACYFAYLAMSSVFSLPPILFMTFREMYGISYTLLGTLVLVNFTTQLTVDLIFTFFSKHFNIKKVIRVMPLITSTGLLIYALIPTIFPQYAYAGLVAGTFVFSIAAGLSEVLLSPVIAALPSDNPERDMSMLHSLYAYGVLMVVCVSTAFLWLFGNENWMYITLFWAALPIVCSVLFFLSPIPDMNLSHESTTPDTAKKRTFALFLCVMCIFLGSAAENAMTNWISGFVESALQIPKVWGDILGLALFAVLLGLTRTWYAKYGKNITTVLLLGMIGATCCYLVAGLSNTPILSLIACILTGIFTSMLWPGTLIMMEENIPHVAVTAYALMAAGGDFGASVAPQMLGIVVDHVAVSDWAAQMSATLSITPEQFGLKVGMLTAVIFPLLGTFLLIYVKRYFKKQKQMQ
ncbi:MAG: MFS transporter [Clostridia bacterium]|nr:MFS transporter [Clostridia bacterium]